MDQLEDDSDYEYEYDETETETFLVDLDLSSLNSVIKPTVPGAPEAAVPAKRSLDSSIPETPDRDDPGDEHGPGLAEERPSQDMEDGGDDSNNSGPSPFPTSVQILDLNSRNPLISYMDQIYSCKWIDMVGTNMFFTSPGLSAESNATMHSTEDYDLLGTSRIKLLGHRAEVSKNAASASEAGVDDAQVNEQSVEADDAPDGRSLGDLHRSNSKVNIQIKRQATFLEKMMDLKRQRGERDIVRAYVDEQSASIANAEAHGAIREEMDELNRRVIKGDAEALARLQEIYSRIESKDQTPQGAARVLPANDAM